MKKNIFIAVCLIVLVAPCFADSLEETRKAAEQGDAKAQFNLGTLYAKGRGVPRDEAEAVKWYRKAAEQGDAVAQNNLGVMYQAGRGVPRDEVEAVKWYRKAAEQGNAVAQFNLGWMYQEGRGVPRDEAEAVKWYRKAAEQGDTAAQANLGWMYRKGRGVPRDYVSAYLWYSLAAAQRDEKARTSLDNLEKAITPEQRVEAQKLAREWKPKKPSAGTIFTTQIPSLFANDSTYELGTRFYADVNGQITAVRLYTNASEGGNHTVRIWQRDGLTPIAGPYTWNISSETAGWKTFTLPTPLSIAANTEYIVAISNSSDKYYAYQDQGFAAPIVNGHLHTYVDSGVYTTTLGTMPTAVWQDTNYFRDVVFVPQ